MTPGSLHFRARDLDIGRRRGGRSGPVRLQSTGLSPNDWHFFKEPLIRHKVRFQRDVCERSLCFE